MPTHVKYHISNCITCSKNLPNVSHYPQLQLEIPKVPFACIAIDTIGKLSTTSSGNRHALTCIDLIIAVPMPDKTAESVVEVYLSGILSRAGASMVCLLDNGLELKNSHLNTVLRQLGIKHIYASYCRDQHLPHNKLIPCAMAQSNVKLSAHWRTAHTQAVTLRWTEMVPSTI